jgi:hypothetical protein
MALNWKTFKKLRENEETSPQGFDEPQYEKDHGHGQSDLNQDGGLGTVEGKSSEI